MTQAETRWTALETILNQNINYISVWKSVNRGMQKRATG